MQHGEINFSNVYSQQSPIALAIALHTFATPLHIDFIHLPSALQMADVHFEIALQDDSQHLPIYLQAYFVQLKSPFIQGINASYTNAFPIKKMMIIGDNKIAKITLNALTTNDISGSITPKNFRFYSLLGSEDC